MSTKALKELLVLGTLRSHPLHGYALVEALEAGLGWAVGLKRSTVYAILRRFVERGWIEGESMRDSRYPEREVYSVTADGEEAHQGLLAGCIDELVEGTHPVAVLLAHMDELDASQRRHALETLRDDRRHRLRVLESFPVHDGLAGSALDLLRAQVRCEIDALDGVLERGLVGTTSEDS